MNIKVKNRSGQALPKYQTIGSAGLDLTACIDAAVELKPLERVLIKTGLSLELPQGVEAQVRPRSGLALKSGVTVLNSPGTIDSDYRGEVGVILINLSDQSFFINSGDRIAQLVFARHETITWQVSEELEQTERGNGGYGHTGKQ